VATIWKGAVSFGLVNIPVRAEPATRDTESVSFRQLDKHNLAPIKMRRVNSVTGDDVEWKDLVKGYEYTKGKFVVVTQEELDALKVPTGRTLDLVAFVDAGEIDPRHYETPYFLIPESTAGRAYALLREAIRDSGVVGVGRVTMRQRTHLVTVRVIEDALVMDVIRPASALVDPRALDLPSPESVRAPEKAMAEQLISHLHAPFDASDFTDEYQVAVRKLVESKLTGVDLETDSDVDAVGTPVIDLMSRLKESLAATGSDAKRERAEPHETETRKRGRASHGAPTKKAAPRRRTA